jgi:phosphodiesterase/alkaline phosphatase D-like protein
MNFVKNTKYYTGTVYEFNLPTGTTCPFAQECKVIVDRVTGKFNVSHGAFRCYAASAERFPGVREHRWHNYEATRQGLLPELPAGAKHVRIHMSGDFYSQAYFDLWLDYARKHPDIKFWAFTKSLPFWIERINEIPENLVLTASYGGKYDWMIKLHNLKYGIVVKNVEEANALGLPIDTNDDYARQPKVSFAMLDNNIAGKAKQKKNLEV